MSGVPENFESRLASRVARLRLELEDEGVPILGAQAHPDGVADESGEALDALVLEELVYARHVPVHEGLRPSYGCLAVAEGAATVEALPSFTKAEPAEPLVGGGDHGEGVVPPAEEGTEAPRSKTPVDLQAIRPLVDGTRTILLRDIHGLVGLVPIDVAEELGVVDATRTYGAVSVQRLPNGRVRVVTPRHIAVNDGHDWTVRPHAGSVVKSLTSELQLPGDRIERMRALGSLLEFCFHSLSPAGIGATLVLALTDSADLETGVSDLGTKPSVKLNVFDRSDQVLLRNILSAVDGACLVDPDGTLQRYQTKLTAAEATESLIGEHGGTRHTSAKRYSFEHPEALAIVVSADGPVTLFCSGAIVASLPDRAPAATWVRGASMEMRGRVTDTTREDPCSQCGTTLVTKFTSDPEGDTAQRVVCVVCGNQVHEIEGTVELSTRVKRPWE